MSENPYQAPQSTRDPSGSKTRRRSRTGSTRRYAGFWARAAAQIIDVIVTTAATALLALVLIPGFDFLEQNTNPDGRYQAIEWGLPLVYTIYFWLSRGATPGKLLLGIQIVDAQGNFPGIGACLLRYVGYVVSAIAFFIGYFWMLWDADSQCIHDKMASTYVVVR